MAFLAKYKEQFITSNVEGEIARFFDWLDFNEMTIQKQIAARNRIFLSSIARELKKVFSGHPRDVLFTVHINEKKTVIEINYQRSSYVLTIATHMAEMLPSGLRNRWSIIINK